MLFVKQRCSFIQCSPTSVFHKNVYPLKIWTHRVYELHREVWNLNLSKVRGLNIGLWEESCFCMQEFCTCAMKLAMVLYEYCCPLLFGWILKRCPSRPCFSIFFNVFFITVSNAQSRELYEFVSKKYDLAQNSFQYYSKSDPPPPSLPLSHFHCTLPRQNWPKIWNVGCLNTQTFIACFVLDEIRSTGRKASEMRTTIEHQIRMPNYFSVTLSLSGVFPYWSYSNKFWHFFVTHGKNTAIWMHSGPVYTGEGYISMPCR